MIYFLWGLFIFIVFLNVQESVQIARGEIHDEYTNPYEGVGCKPDCVRCNRKTKLERILE